MSKRLPWTAGLLVGASLLACYNPNIAPGGFRCGANKACPDGFQCSNGLCYRDAGMDVGPICDAAPPAALCATAPTSGQACNPACQTGCACGWCAIDGTASCSTAARGTKRLGDVCDPHATASQCMPGYICQPECNSVGRCYRVCNGDADCAGMDGGASTCSVRANGSAFSLCTQASCDPFSGAGCPAGTACYGQFGAQPFCACQGTRSAGASCTNIEDCAPGYICVGPAGSSTCVPLCSTTNDTCMADGGARTCQLPTGGPYGYCM